MTGCIAGTRWPRYYIQIVGADGALSGRNQTQCKRQMTVKTWLEGEEGKKKSCDVERLEKEILGLLEQLSRIAENVLAKEQQLSKLDADY